MSRSGVLEAMELGSTVVIGQAVGQDPETGETVVYSQVNKLNLYHGNYDKLNTRASNSKLHNQQQKKICSKLF